MKSAGSTRPRSCKHPVQRPTVASAIKESLISASSRKAGSDKKASLPHARGISKPGQGIRPQVSSKPSAAAHKHWQNHAGGTGTSGKPSISQERDWTKEKVIQTRSKQLLNANLEFYKNKLRSKPGGHLIEDILKWEKNYDRLEKNHRYIQWLFPLPGSKGKNPQSQPLQEHEAMEISSKGPLKERVLRAYKMMLDFYGMDLQSSETGQIRRSKNWAARYRHLNSSHHNWLRISRILKSLGCLGYEQFQFPWLQFILQEAVINRTLPNLDCGAVHHWIMALKNAEDQKMMRQFYREIKHGEVPTDPKIDSVFWQDDGLDDGDDDE